MVRGRPLNTWKGGIEQAQAVSGVGNGIELNLRTLKIPGTGAGRLLSTLAGCGEPSFDPETFFLVLVVLFLAFLSLSCRSYRT